MAKEKTRVQAAWSHFLLSLACTMAEDLAKLTVVLLKERLKAVGLATNGRKADLVARLVCFLPLHTLQLFRALIACFPPLSSSVVHLWWPCTSSGWCTAFACVVSLFSKGCRAWCFVAIDFGFVWGSVPCAYWLFRAVSPNLTRHLGLHSQLTFCIA